jgi:glycosyltransferase involved in cell wall biosynthesis
MTSATASTGYQPLRILLLSAYDAPSHRYWREGLERYCAGDVFTQLALPPRFFSWRIRGNSLSWAFSERAVLQRDYDLLIATSQVDLSALRGFVPQLAKVPSLLYFHENQFAYPASGDAHASVEPQMVNLYSALCADGLVFNSQWNRDSFLSGVEQLLRRLPDQVPAGLPAQLASMAHILPVPIDESATAAHAPGSRVHVVWNHRWEYDKGPAALLAAIQCSIELGLPLCWHIVGQQFKRQPAQFARIADLLREHTDYAGYWGYIPRRQDYRDLLARADVVLSTALHEFQGLAVMEAVMSGCRPLVPDRLSYPELFAPGFRFASTPLAPEQEGRQIAQQLQLLVGLARRGEWLGPPPLEQYTWPLLGPVYRQLMHRCAAGGLRSAGD